MFAGRSALNSIAASHKLYEKAPIKGADEKPAGGPEESHLAGTTPGQKTVLDQAVH